MDKPATTPEHWWAYLDGTLSEADRNTWEELLRSNPEMALTQETARAIHQSLQKAAAPDSPSMRFSQSLMERLPQRYRRFEAQPLLEPRTQRFLILGLLMAVAGSLAISFIGQSTPAGITEPASPAMAIINTYTKTVLTFPATTLLIIMSLVSGFVLYLGLDWYLLSRLKNRKQSPLT